MNQLTFEDLRGLHYLPYSIGDLLGECRQLGLLVSGGFEDDLVDQLQKTLECCGTVPACGHGSVEKRKENIYSSNVSSFQGCPYRRGFRAHLALSASLSALKAAALQVTRSSETAFLPRLAQALTSTCLPELPAATAFADASVIP